uniref:SAP domain-containing protein n=1 Tax=Knipowitschia caucasica TaxID=637954 RepID=A0AAV2L9B8_KNICA
MCWTSWRSQSSSLPQTSLAALCNKRLLQEHNMEASQLGAEGDGEMTVLLAPSPQSEAMTYEMEELSLQPLPPLNERKNVLQLRLQQRRTREQLVDQGIMPPLKSPATFHGQIRSLERARTENFLKHKIRSRPERAELVRMHILQETGAEPSLQATQMKLKRARLADDLNEKIAQRPGPMELVEKNILPVDSTLKQAIIVGQVNYPKVLDEDSCDALSPERPASQESPGDGRVQETPAAPQFLPVVVQSVPVTTPTTTGFVKVLSTSEHSPSALTQPQPATISPPPKPGPTLIKQSQQKSGADKSRSKKSKEAKSRMKKLKYHQYVPPDQKQDSTEAHMDSSYARLLQQQQLFLQLQILSQQQQHYNYQTILPAPLKPVTEGHGGTNGLPTSIVVSLPTAPPASPLPGNRPLNTLSSRRPGVLPTNLEEMKVAELKLELKLRGLPVSGTKTDLMERLKPFQDPISSVPMEVASTTPAIVLPYTQRALRTPTPPVSPQSQDGGLCEQVPPEKDRQLHEKQRQIEELMKKLEQEQRLVEELKLQLEVEKTVTSSEIKPEVDMFSNCNTILNTIQKVYAAPSAGKYEDSLSNCLSSTSSLLGSVPAPTVVKLEDVTVSSSKPLQMQSPTQLLKQTPPHKAARTSPTPPQPPLHKGPGLQQFFISHAGGVSQVLGQPQILVPVSLPNNTIQLPHSMSSSGQSTFILQPAPLLPQPKNEPPRYEDAVKQSRCLLSNTPSQVSTTTSQQMDDLFDILIESGEMAPFPQQEAPVCVNKTQPVTAHISTLPVNTVLCRPPLQVQLAPSAGLGPAPPRSCLSSEQQLEALLEGTLVDSSPADVRTRGLIEELQAQLMEQQSYSPMDTSELSFSSSPPSSLDMGLSDPTLDNMEWLDLTMPPGPGPLTPLSIPSDFLDSHDLQLHWD